LSQNNSSQKICNKNSSQIFVTKIRHKNSSQTFVTIIHHKNSSQKETETYKRTKAKEPGLQQQQHKSQLLEASLVRQADGKLKNP
jgi:hypothetical protein